MTQPPTPREPLAEADAQKPETLPDKSERHDPYTAWRHPNFRKYFVGNAFALFGTQMTFFAARVELYQRTHSAAILGLIGLVQVVPIILLALPAGHFIDRHNRKHLLLGATALQIVLFILLGFSSVFSDRFALANGSVFLADPHVTLMLLLFMVNGSARAINQPTRQSLLPQLVPAEHFSNAVTWNLGLFETSNIAGPLLAAGALALLGENPHYTWAYAMIYWTNALFQIINWLNMLLIQIDHKPRPREPLTLKSMLAGAKFVYTHKVILAAITLDMFAVLLGGAITMLPVFAAQVLHVGALKLGALQVAASVGTITMSLILTHRPPMQRAGRNLLWAVTGFGLAIIVFGLSQNFWLSLAAALFFTGFFDSISVVIRHSLVQLNTPDDMRGRMSAVNSVFISSSNELGDTESGMTISLASRFLGSLWGPMIAVASGGVGTIVVVITAAILWPELRRVGRLDKMQLVPAASAIPATISAASAEGKAVQQGASGPVS